MRVLRDRQFCVSVVVSGFSRTVIATLALALAGCGSNTKAGTHRDCAGVAPRRRSTARRFARSRSPICRSWMLRCSSSLRDGYAALTAKIGKPAISDVDLGFAYGEMGKLLMAAEYRDAAEPAFLNAEALTPNERRWPYYLAHLYKLKGDAQQATASFERALQAEARRSADARLARQRVSRSGTRRRCRAALRDGASRSTPRSVPVLFGLGRTALAKQEYARAVDYLEQALTLDPKAAVIHFPLAMAYRGDGRRRRRPRRTCGREVRATSARPIR